MELSRLPGFLLRRGIKAAIVILAIVVCNFLLIHAAPGDPASVIAGQSGAADERFLAQLREQFGLDKPFHVQLWIYLKGVLTLDLGFSHRQQQPVWTLISDRLPATLLLTGAAFAFAVTAGVTLGTLAARRVGRWADSVITVIALTFYATPIFWVGLMLVLFFSATQFFFFDSSGFLSLAGIGSLAAGIAFTFFELLVIALQAYIFALLTAVYIDQSIHADQH